MPTWSCRLPGAARLCALGLAALSVITAGCGLSTFHPYEYEEDIYLALDGTATVYVNGSVPALVALRGLPLDVDPTVRVDRQKLRALYEGPHTRVMRITTSRRGGRWFAHLTIEVDDVRRLAETAPFAWSRYQFGRDGALFVYRQSVGPPVDAPVRAGWNGRAGWDGREIVAFRLHLPSKITSDNAQPEKPRRGNILVWEQTLERRLSGQPLQLDVRMETESILYRTLALFGVTLGAVALAFGAVIWWVFRRGTAASSIRGSERPSSSARDPLRT